MESYSRIFVILVSVSVSLPNIKCSTLQKCQSEGQRIPDSVNPSKFYLCHHFTKTNNWHSYPFHCSKGLRFDSSSQDCISSIGNAKSESTPTQKSGTPELHAHPISNLPIFNGIARLIRSASGFPSPREEGTENADIILSLASSIKSLAMTVEKLATVQMQKSGPCLAAPTTTTTTPQPQEPLTQEIKLERLPIYEIFRPVTSVEYIRDNEKIVSHEQNIINIDVPAVDRLDVNAANNATGESVKIPQVQSTESTPATATVSSTTATVFSSTAAASSTPATVSSSAPKVASSTAKPTSTSQRYPITSTDEDYSASEEHAGIPPHQAYPQPGNNILDFLFTNIFKRPIHQQRRPVPQGNIHRLPGNRLPVHFLDHRFETTTARNIFLPQIQLHNQRHPIRIPVLHHTNSPHNAFPAVEHHPLPNGGKLVNLVSLFNHLSGIGTPVSTMDHEIEDSDHFIVPVPVPNETLQPVSATISHLQTSTVPTTKAQTEGPLISTPIVSTKIINSIPEDTEEEGNGSRLNDRRPRM